MKRKSPKSSRHETTTTVKAQCMLSRREMLRNLGYGTAGTMFLLTGLRAGHAGPATTLEQMAGRARGGLQSPTQDDHPQLPLWGDGARWDRPEYYETIVAGRRVFPKTLQSADLDGDGRDELIGRGPGGILVNSFEPSSGQWIVMRVPNFTDGGGLWRDDYGWNNPQYYETIQCADIDLDGKAELIGRGGNGIEVYQYDPNALPPQWIPLSVPARPEDGGIWSDLDGWNKPQYFSTIQCADIDGDGRAELIGRGGKGIEAWQFNADTKKWGAMALPLANWQDSSGWYQPEYYQTIQCADINGDGQAELIGRGGNGIEIYWWDKTAQPAQWKLFPAPPDPDHPNLTIWNGLQGWSQPEYYQTIQCADLDGDGQAELIGRGAQGIEIYKYNKSTAKWEQQSAPKFTDSKGLWRDDYGWNHPQYYQTIQCADIDGDGQAELIGRGGEGIEVYYCNRSITQWNSRPLFTNWSDVNGWGQVQFYATLQNARVLKPGDIGYTGDGVNTQAALLGRGSVGMQTIRYDSDSHQWVPASLPITAVPPLNDAQQKAFNQLDVTLRQGGATGNIRSTYQDTTAPFSTWMSQMYNSPPLSYDLPPAERPSTDLDAPDGVDENAWEAVVWQIYWEMLWVTHVQEWFNTDMQKVITDGAIGKGLALQDVGNKMEIPPDSSLNILFDVLAMLASAAAAALTIGIGPAAAAAAAAANFIGVACREAASKIPGGSTFQAQYNNLQDELTKSFSRMLDANSDLIIDIVGGEDLEKNQHPVDYGLLRAIGQMIHDTTWSWSDTLTSSMVLAMTRSYAAYVWQTLMAAQPWYVWTYDPGNPGFVPDSVPRRYIYKSGSFSYWLSTSAWFYYRYPQFQSDLFDPPSPSSQPPFPLDVPLADVFTGANGWPTLEQHSVYGRSPHPPKTGQFGFTLVTNLDANVVLSRDANTQQILAEVTLSNRGLTVATNVEITEASFKNLSATANHTSRLKRIHLGNPKTFLLRFPNLPGETKTLLHVAGRYLDGQFKFNLQVQLP